MFKDKSVQAATSAQGKKALHQLEVGPFVRVIATDGRKLLMLDSCMDLDLDRKLVIQTVHAQNPVFSVSRVSQGGDELALTLSVRDMESQEEKTLLTMRLDLQDYQVDVAGLDGLQGRVRDKFLRQLAAEWAMTYSPEKNDGSCIAPVAGAVMRTQAQTLPVYAPATVSAQPVSEKADTGKKGYKRLVPWLAAAFAFVLLVVGLNTLLSKKERDPFAGADPTLLEQIESSGFHGATSDSPSNVTEQTLRAMGLDPGKAAANMNCLAN